MRKTEYDGYCCEGGRPHASQPVAVKRNPAKSATMLPIRSGLCMKSCTKYNKSSANSL